MITYDIKERRGGKTYVVFTNSLGDSVGQLFDGSPSEPEIMERGAELLPDPLSFEELKEQKIEQINFYRDLRLNGGFMFMEKPIDSDPTSRANIVGEALSATIDEPFPAYYTWRCADNTNLPMTAGDVVNMARTMRAFILSTYAASWALKAAVDAAQTPEDLAAIHPELQ